jgi:hypothetical protein
LMALIIMADRDYQQTMIGLEWEAQLDRFFYGGTKSLGFKYL